MGRLFGTDGIRGVANVEPMTAQRVLEIGRAVAYTCKMQKHQNEQQLIVIGKDTRLSGYMFENALTAGICSMGVHVYLVGPMPTPGIAFITRSMRAAAGMVLSASHNPYQDNGIKIFSRDGYKLADEIERHIEDLVLSGRIENIRPTAEQVGRATRIDDARGRYIVFCKRTFPEKKSLEGLKIVLDCGNGATYRIAPIIFAELGAAVSTIHCEPNGLNINLDCGALHPRDLIDKVLETKADIGLAFDGDGDRLIAVDEKGREVNGDHILAICAYYYKEGQKLANNRVVTTVMANCGLYKTLNRMGVEYEVAPVGDRYVLELMQQKNAVLGGETSGHMIFLDQHTTGDGIITALQILAALQTHDGPLSSLADMVTLFPQQMINVEVSRKPPLEEVPKLQEAIRAAERELQDEGRVLVRYSGTQSLCRVMVEGPTDELTAQIAECLAETVRIFIG